MANPLRAAAEICRTPRALGGGSSSFGGAQVGRLTSDWVLATIKSADQEIRADYRTLKARSRELVRNNDTASRYVGLVDEQAVGPDGIRLQAQVTRPDGMLDLGINQRIEDAFEEWCEPGNCTVDGIHGWIDVLSNWAITTPQDGEWLARMLPFQGNRFGFALQLLDTDQLDHEFNRAPGDGGTNEIRLGVEIDRWSRPVAYHVWDHHPSEYSARGRERIALPASQIVHYFRAKRTGQTRGVPWFASALTKLRHIGGYEEAEIIAARMAAAKGGFFEVDPIAVPDPNAPNPNTQQFTFEIEPGVIDRLPPGWKFTALDPQHPTTAFKDFHKAMVRGVAAGLGVSYVSLANDLEGVNFSSIRAGLLNERDAWRRMQRGIIRHFCSRVYREWMKWALATGALVLPDRNRDRWMNHRFQPRGWPWVDPLKDMQAGLLGVAAGVNSLTRMCAEQGLDFDQVLIERAAEIQLAHELGVPISLDTTRSDRSSGTDNTDGSDTGGDGNDGGTNKGSGAMDERVAARLRKSRVTAALPAERVSQLLHANGNGRHQ